MKPIKRYKSDTPVDLTADVFTSGEVAAILRCSARAVTTLIDSGRLKGCRITSTRQVCRDDLIAFLREKKADHILRELAPEEAQAADIILLAGLPIPLEQRLRDLMPGVEVRTVRSLFTLGLALHHPPRVAVVDLSIGGRDEVRCALAKFVEDCARVVAILPEDAPSVLHLALEGTGCHLLQHPVDAVEVVRLAGLAERGGAA